MLLFFKSYYYLNPCFLYYFAKYLERQNYQKITQYRAIGSGHDIYPAYGLLFHTAESCRSDLSCW
jgi:hypothetical protein